MESSCMLIHFRRIYSVEWCLGFHHYLANLKIVQSILIENSYEVWLLCSLY